METNKTFHTPKESGNLTVEISFKKNLTSLKNFFSNNSNLIKVDLKDFNMDLVVSMESIFSGCINLYEVDLEGVNSQNLININNAFEKCKKLMKVNFSMKNISEFLESVNTFKDCENLQFINLSSFQNIKNDMFLGIKSNPTIQANELISKDLNYIFHINLNITINIIITSNESNNECIKGNDDKCKDCSIIIKKNCAACNDGYYLPFNSINREKCLSCDIIEHCSSCIGNEKNVLCFSCKEGFYLKNNKCEKNQKYIPLCQVGENELCKSCNSDNDLRNECATYNEGYYLASDLENKTFCQNCNKIESCNECFGNLNNPISLKCKDGFRLEYNLCVEKEYDIGIEDKCKTCKNEDGRKMECDSCNDGYYLEEKKISYKCSKCSIENFKKCSVSSGNEICHECNNDFILIKDNNKRSYSCICPSYYQLTEDNHCKKTGNWVEAEYDVDITLNGNNIPDHLIAYKFNILYKVGNTFNLNEVEAYINKTKIQLSIENHYVYYKFSRSRIYKVLINFKI